MIIAPWYDTSISRRGVARALTGTIAWRDERGMIVIADVTDFPANATLA